MPPSVAPRHLPLQGRTRFARGFLPPSGEVRREPGWGHCGRRKVPGNLGNTTLGDAGTKAILLREKVSVSMVTVCFRLRHEVPSCSGPLFLGPARSYEASRCLSQLYCRCPCQRCQGSDCNASFAAQQSGYRLSSLRGVNLLVLGSLDWSPFLDPSKPLGIPLVLYLAKATLS